MAQNVTDASFTNDVLNSEGFVLIDFWAGWCGPCRQLSPIIDQVSEEMKDQLQIFKMNIEENPEIPSKLGVRGIPTLVLFKDGKQIATKVGSLSKTGLCEWINSEISE